MKYTSKLILNGEEYQFAAPSGGGGRQPGADTVVYYPLEEDINDYSGNNRNLTNMGNAYSFTTNTQGYACCELNPQDTDSTYFTTGLSGLCDFANEDYTFVSSVCDFSSTLSSSWDGTCIFSFGNQFKNPGFSTTTGNSGLGKAYNETGGVASHTGNWGTDNISFRGSDFVTVINVWDHATNTWTNYVDGALDGTVTMSYLNSYNGSLVICKDTYSNTATRCVHAKVKGIIIESRAWTAEEAAAYTLS